MTLQPSHPDLSLLCQNADDGDDSPYIESSLNATRSDYRERTDRPSVPDADDPEYHESNASTQGPGYQKGRTSLVFLVRVRSTTLEMLRVIVNASAEGNRHVRDRIFFHV